MDALLRWSIENSSRGTVSGGPDIPKQPLDPGIIDAILGKPDAEQMKVRNGLPRTQGVLCNALLSQDNLRVALDESKPLGDRVIALDNFEMVRIHPLFRVARRNYTLLTATFGLVIVNRANR